MAVYVLSDAAIARGHLFDYAVADASSAGKVIWDHSRTRDGTEVRDVAVESANGAGQIRRQYYIKGRRLYAVGGIGRTSKANDGNLERFLNSFHLL